MLTAVFIYEPTIILLLVLTVFPICIIFYLKIRAKINSAGHIFQKYQVIQNKVTSEAIKGYVDLEIKNKFDYYFRKHAANADKIGKVQTSLSTLMQMPQKVIETGIILGLVLIVLMGQFYYHDYSRLSALLGLFGIMAFRLLPSLNRMVMFTLNLKQYQYVFSLFDEIHLEKVGDYTLPSPERMSFSKSIILDSILFRYNKDVPVLNKLNIEIRKGEIVGIIGKSGAGKSTLLNLMLNFIEPESGSIKVDGVTISSLNADKWRNIIGYVPQDVFVAEATLAENIAFAEDAMDEVRLNNAIGLANLESFVSSLPLGVNTFLTEGGGNLSGGQRQRIGIARALYKNAEVLFFDEATSSLDSRTEEEISNSIRSLSLKERSITIVIIAHRITTLRCCSRIVELKEGRIAKELKYEEIVK
jgi:ABC-type bacteriocin/lantibiotic exporter with double-glycine peptidase domain